MNNLILLVSVIVAIIIIIAIVLYLISNSRKNKEEVSSILDVNEVGVSNNTDFSYGYEKEETIVMNPVDSLKEENKDEVGNSKEEFPDIKESEE